jgi:hypothetical protein
MHNLVRFVLKLSADLFGTTVPETARSTDVIGYNLFKRAVLDQVFKDVQRPHVPKLLYVFLLDSPRHVLTHFLKRLWPEKSELRLRYGIREDSTKLHLYYALNPIIFPLMMIRKRKVLT